MYVKIDENRIQTAGYSDFAGKGIDGALRVDCFSPGANYRLKSDYQNYSGTEQWEFNQAFKNAHDREKALSKTVFSKLAIRRALRALNQENMLDDLLAASELFNKDWNDAAEIDLNDEMTAQAIVSAEIDIDRVKLAIAGITEE